MPGIAVQMIARFKTCFTAALSVLMPAAADACAMWEPPRFTDLLEAELVARLTVRRIETLTECNAKRFLILRA